MSRCGAGFRKPVQEISDRAKRYRAHSPGCRPKGPKVCFKCGSRRNVVPDHIDGDESNGKRSNLRWACKSHNTILGKQMAKAGKGVRTRQYNPAGAINLAQYIQAAVDHTRGSHDEAGKIIHDTPKAKRREFAREIWFRRGYRGKNPAKRSLAKRIDALLPQPVPNNESDFFADLEDRLLGKQPGIYKKHATRKPSWIAKKNPSEADELYRKFHGRGPDKITTLLVAGVDPYGGHPELTSLGPLIRLVVGENVEIDDDGEVEAADRVNEITFVPSMAEYRKLTEQLDPKSAADVRAFRAWLKSVGAPDVAGVPPRGDQLYFVGGKQGLDDAALRKLGSDPAKDLADLGDCFLIEYFAQKRFDRFEPITYFHGFGEISGVQPRLIYRKPQKMLELVGGEYVVKAAGIDN
jgi:hypothetical protein